MISNPDKQKFLRQNAELEKLFVYELSSFYDILFIDNEGKVFYSVKMEDDFRSSLIDGPYSQTKLAQIVKSHPSKLTFVDFEYYGASDEAAAFYILPVISNGSNSGVIALQLSINHLNTLLTNRDGLGRTGEAYLVNNQKLMLTQSRFINSDTILSKKIDTSAVHKAGDMAKHSVIDDYRRVKVLSSYQSLRIGNSTWKLLVEKDESEVITDYYNKYSDSLFPQLVQAIATDTHLNIGTAKTSHQQNRTDSQRVDVGELIKADERGALYTPGVATCTAILSYKSDKEFSYLAHLSPVDISYDLSSATLDQLGNKSTDLISLMIRRIKNFEIKPHEIDSLNFIIVAPHDLSLKKSLNLLIDAGISLKQIRVAILFESNSASVYYKDSNSAINSIWEMDGIPSSIEIDLNSLKNLDELVHHL